MNANPVLIHNSEVAVYQGQLRAHLQYLAERHAVPGLGLALFANGHWISATAGDIVAGVAPMPATPLFDLGRAARLLMSVRAFELAASGKLAFRAPVASYLPELAGSEFGESVLVEHLLADTCGFRPQRGMDMEILPAYSWERLIASLKKAERLFEPGSVFSLLLETRALLVEIVRRVAGADAASMEGMAVQRGLVANATGNRTRNRVVGHMLDPRSGRAVPIPPFQVGEFWRPILPELHVGTKQLLEFMLGVEPALREQRTGLPRLAATAGVESLPIAVGPGLHEFAGDWVGLNGPLFGQSMTARVHKQRDVAFACGANMQAPDVVEDLLRSLSESLGLGWQPGSVEQPTPFAPQELLGEYTGITGPPVHIRARGEDLACEVVGRSRLELTLIRVEGGWRAEAGGQAMGFGFFQCPDARPGLMLGPVAYHKAEKA